MKKRLISVFLSLCIIISLLPSAALAVSTDEFSDFPASSHWAYDALSAAVDNGLLKGNNGKLMPEGVLTRAQLAAVINRAFGATEKADISGFSDVASTAWYAEDIAKAVHMGTFAGNGAGLMRPDDAVTRQEAFAVLARAFHLDSGSASDLAAFTDSGSVGTWAVSSVAAMVNAGYVAGNGKLINPLSTITRQEFAQVMYRMVSGYYSAANIYTSVVTGNLMVNTAGVTLKGVTVNGDLIIADGVGSGGVTLDGVTVTGRIVVRGGGESALNMINKSSVAGKIIAAKAGVGISADDGSSLTQVAVNANNVTVTAKTGTVTAGAGVTGTKVNGEALPAGQSFEITAAVTGGGGGGGGSVNPPATVVATTSLSITPPSTALQVGTGYNTLTVARNSGANDALTWESDDESVIKVNATSGKLSAVGTGSATISAESASGVVGSTTVYVVNPSGTALANYTITEPGTVLENCSFTKLTIAASVGTGEVTLRNVTADEMVVLGGGQNTVQAINGYYRHLFFNGTSIEGTRLLVSGDAVISNVEIGDGASNGVTLEKETGSTASIGEITADAPTTVKGADVTKITASSNLTVTNSTVTEVETTGTSPAVTLTDSVVNKVNATAASTTIGGNSAVSEIAASGSVITGTDTAVGTIDASSGANITANGAVGSVTGTAGSVSLNNSGSTAVTASAGSVSVSGESKPTVSGTVPTVTVAANSEGTSGVTVTGTTANINTTGAGSVGEISIGGSANPAVNTGSTAALVSVSDTAGATVTGSDAKVVNTSTGSNTVTNSGTQVAAVTPTLQYIAVTSLPAKTEYAVGSTLNAAGLVVTGYYTVPGFDGTISKAVTGYTTGTWDGNAGTHEVTVTHEGKTATFNVKVVAKTVASISIKTAPTTKTYDLSNGAQTLTVVGGTVTVNYTSSLYPAETKNIESGWCSITSGTNLTTVGAKTVTVTYEGKTAAFTVNVINSAADAFALAQSNAKAEFLAYASDKLINNTYSETGKASMKKTRDAGVDAIGALIYPTNDTAAIATALTTHKTNINNILTQDGEWTRDANGFKSAHSAILTKTAATVLIGDKANVSAALSAYNALESGVKNKLTTEKALLDSFLAKISTIEAAQTIDAAKQSAKATLTSALTGYNSGYSESLSAIQSAKTAGDTAITNATTVVGVTTALDAALANMASFKSDAQILADAKTTSINTINTYLPGSMAQDAYNTAYNATGKAQVSELRAAGVETINTATTTTAVTDALNAAKTSINGVKTAAGMAAETLAAAKSAAVNELRAYGDRTAYRSTQQTTFDNAKTTGESNINAATTTAAVTAALKAAKTAIDAIKTDTQLTASELAAAKTTAKSKLNSYYPSGKIATDYSATGNSLIAAMRSAGCTAIDAASDANAVAAALAAAKTSINGVTDIVGENTAAVAAAKTAAEGASYAAVSQSAYDTEAKLSAYVKGIAETAVGAGITVAVTKTAYIAPISGTFADPDGTNGSYSFTVSLTKGSANATTATRSVTITATAYTASPTVTVTPGSASVDYMGGTTLTAATSDIQNPTYQWYKGSTAIDGETGATLTLTSLTATATYHCMCGTIKSNEVTVTVAAQGASAVPTAVISGMAANYTLPYSGNITLTVATADTYAYKWESKTGSGEWTQVGTGATLGIADLAIGMNGTQYRCTVTNTEQNKLPASATSEIVTLNIQKGTQTAPTGLAAVQASFGASDGKITGATTAMEYKLSTATVYTTCTDTEITGLAAGTYLVRYAETANLSASADAEVVILAASAPIMAGGTGYTDLQSALTAAGTEQPVEIVGDYTIVSDATVTVGVNQNIKVVSGGSLTNSGTIQFHSSSVAYEMSDSGKLIVEQGGSYTVGTTKLIGGSDAVFNLLEASTNGTEDTADDTAAGEIVITGAPKDAASGNDYALPFVFLNGNIKVPAGKTYTVSGSDYMTFIANGDLTVNGSLTSTAFNEVRGGITVESTGSLTLNNSAQTGGPAYSIGDESVPHSMGGSVFVKQGGSYTVGTTKLIGTSGAKLNMTSGDAMICGQPADGGENPFVFVFGGAKATAGEYDWQHYHFIVDAYTDNGTTHTATLTIPQNVTVTLGSNEIRGNIINNGTLVATNGLGVNGSITNNGTITNHDTIHLLPGASMTNNNGGKVNGTWISNNNPEDENDGWCQTQILVEFSDDTTKLASASLTNSGTINDSVTIRDYFGDAQSGDKLTAFTNTGTIAETYRVAYVETTAALKRAIADTTVNEYHPIKSFVLTESVTIPDNHLLYVPVEWYNGDSDVTTSCSFTINSGITLTNNGGAELMGLTTVNGSIVNNGYIYSESRYLENGTQRGICGSGSVTGDGEYNVVAYACSAAGITAAASNNLVSEIHLVPASDYDFYNETDVVAERTVTLSENVTIPAGKALIIERLDVKDGSTLPVVLVVPAGKTLTVNGELKLMGKLVIENGGTVSGTGTITKGADGELVNSGTLNITPDVAVTTEAQLRAALTDTPVGKIIVGANIKLTSDIDLTKPVTIAEGWDNDIPAVILTVPSGKSLTISADMDVKGGLVGENGSITIDTDKTVTVTGRMGYISSDASAKLTVNGTLEFRNGAGLVLGNHYEGDHATVAGSVVNNGAIEVINGWVDFVESDEETVVSGTAINYYANRADLARELVNRLAGYPNMVEPEDTDYTSYGNAYSDWGELYGNDEDESNDDNDAAHGFAWLLKNSIINGVDGRIYPYGELPAADAKAIFTALATKILGASYTNTDMTAFLDSDALKGGYINTTKFHVNEGNYDTNALNQLIDDFMAALNLSNESVTNEAELTAALAKSYVAEIHITADMTIIGKKDSESDENNSFYLSGVENSNRKIYIDAGATLTVGDGAASTKLDVQQGVELIINGHLTIAANSGINVFGGLKPDIWDSLVTQGENTYINFFPDVMDFGQRLADKVSTRLAAATVTDEVKNSANEWPADDDRNAGFDFLVTYGELSYKTETEGYKHWTPYEKLEYGTAISVLTNVYKAIVTDASSLPDNVKLEGYTDPTWLVNDNDLNALLEKLAAELPALPKADDNTASFTVDGTEQLYSDKNYTNSVTISYSGTPDANGWGGEIKFENCTFAAGVTVNYSDSARFAVDFSDSCTVTDGMSVVPNNSTTLWKNNNVEVRGAMGLAVTASAPTSISCGSGERFTLNGVVVSGNYGEIQDENWFNANIRYNCDAEHAENFDWSNGGDHSECKMSGGETAATTSPEFQLCTGSDGSIMATGTGIAYNVRVEGTADISGLTVADGKEITVSDNDRAASVNIGANTVYVYDNGGKGYTFTGTGTATVRGQTFGNVSGITLGTVDLGTPHVFGDSASGYQIFVGYPKDGITSNVTFTVKQGDSVLTHAVDAQYLAADGKLHLKDDGDTSTVWITDPGNVTLTVTTDGVTAVYEPLAFK